MIREDAPVLAGAVRKEWAGWLGVVTRGMFLELQGEGMMMSGEARFENQVRNRVSEQGFQEE